MKRKILRLKKVYNHNFFLIYISILEQKCYAVSVKHEAFGVIFSLMSQIIEKLLRNKPIEPNFLLWSQHFRSMYISENGRGGQTSISRSFPAVE